MAKSKANPNPKPAQPVIEILDETPSSISRPLTLLDSFAYAASWLDVQITDKAIKSSERHLFIVRDDGVVFSDLVDQKFDDINNIGVEVALPGEPRPGKLWSGKGVKSFMKGDRPDPKDVFCRIADVIDRFIDFTNSYGDQRLMAEFVACYVLATWFLDAFNVIGILWPHGERGSGKTQLLIVAAELSYLGEVIHTGGSFASIRDLADYGATLAFDDAENLSDPRQADPDKRTLLLAGNRRGTYVSLKEHVNGKKWRTRHVHAYSPKLISAISLPDPVLGSRTIMVPLVRSIDKDRANADPFEYDLWPHDRRQLLDDLWALGLTYLPDMPKYDRDLTKHVRLSGRSLQPWRAVLGIALWMDNNGMPGLWERMERLSWKYHNEEHALLHTGDLSHLVLQSIHGCALSANKAMNAVKPEWYFTTAEIVNKAVEIAKSDEIDIDLNRITARRVGRILSNMRFKPVRRDGSKGRGWLIARSELINRCKSYGIFNTSELQKEEPEVGLLITGQPIEGTNVTDGTIGTELYIPSESTAMSVEPEISQL